ncbi:berberine bridge enzyme-like D-2 [Phragmites australis]|uniref:berberine bridge enzyme-like D-2 n=1 Tax=Phragmites australis TaxID=29695 RepID=UPI002D787E31|nr:berberine bridge enzyme-like D-2 [Phragmites australis]
MAALILFSLVLHLFAVQASSDGDDASFTACLAAAGVRNVTTRQSPAYDAALRLSIANLRFAGAGAPKPAAIVVPASLDELRAAVRCARGAGLVLRLRSGGHSYEGLSYTTEDRAAFAVVDLAALDRVRVDAAGSRTAWVESGATLGQVYHAVAESSPTLAFSAGSCPTVGSGGHIGGGGFGLLSRKYGLAGDNVIDAVLVDADGRVLDRAEMGEDVFWAIRGGGGGTWGAVYAWRIQLVPVPERVTTFIVNRPGTIESVARLVSTWQHVAPWLPDDFFVSAFVGAGLPELNRTGISVTFKGLYVGPSHEAVQILAERFPEIGLSDLNPREMSWIESALFFSGLPQGSSVSDLADRVLHKKNYFKAKSDYVRRPTPFNHLIRAVGLLSKEPKAYVILDPYGGAMDRIGSTDLPFPHRKGNIHGIQYLIEWTTADDRNREEYMDWLRRFYDSMAAYVANNPRTAYINYMDLDLGTNNWSGHLHLIESPNTNPNPEVEAARVWGERYFLSNYDRLVRAKTMIDPENVFRNAQSIPPTKSPRGISPKVAANVSTYDS